MKVSKAIEIMEYHKPSPNSVSGPDLIDAIKLGIEALKRHRDRDYNTYNGMHELLPGETPEEDIK